MYFILSDSSVSFCLHLFPSLSLPLSISLSYHLSPIIKSFILFLLDFLSLSHLSSISALQTFVCMLLQEQLSASLFKILVWSWGQCSRRVSFRSYGPYLRPAHSYQVPHITSIPRLAGKDALPTTEL